MKKLLSIFLITALFTVLLNACSKDEKAVAPPVPGNEFLTSVQLVATNNADASDVQMSIITDTTIIPNPPSGINQPTLHLKVNSQYSVEVKFLDETKSPAGDVTADIYDRRNYHLICFEVSKANLIIVRTDKDTNTPALEIGLQNSFTTSAESTGTLNLQLRHQPNAKNGSCDPGSSDADVTFNIVIN